MQLFHSKSDIRSVIFISLAIALYAVQWLGLVRHPALFVTSLCFAFIACIINHNHQHHRTFIPESLNKTFGMIISLAIGVPATAINSMHNLNHHVHNNGADDLSRVSIIQFRWNLISLLLYPFVAIARYLPTKSRELKSWRNSRPELYRQLVLERLVVYPTLLALLAIRPVETLVYLALPYFFGQWAIIAINHVQHFACDPNSEYNHSRNFVGRWLNWWTFNNGYHTAHHSKPGLHWSRLPDFHAEMCEKIDPELQRQSFFCALLEIYLWPACVPSAMSTNSFSRDQDEASVFRGDLR